MLLRTIEAFPNGRTTEELLALLNVDFNPNRRMAYLNELDVLQRERKIQKGRDGKWRAAIEPTCANLTVRQSTPVTDVELDEVLLAAPALFSEEPVPESSELSDDPGSVSDPFALLRYWRSALRADPRGATTEIPENHGTSWHLLTGAGRIAPPEQTIQRLIVETDHLLPAFRKTLLLREANEQGLALGWPIAVGRRNGTPAVWPVGLLSATWSREAGKLLISVEADDILVNPDWIRFNARRAGLNVSALQDIFSVSDGQPLVFDDFVERLRETMADQLQGRLADAYLSAQINPNIAGIYNVAGLFLPTDSTFTAGAVRDLDAIGNWSRGVLEQTALASVLGMAPNSGSRRIQCLNTDSLNAEQLDAVDKACTAPLTVITGPPGTGKSQAIVAMAASVLAAGGSVLVASKSPNGKLLSDISGL